ncbi:hypothetical protein [Mucilaginibacter antarcticus]|uniref:Outer membrane protein with beta-barrel domain n=1 Tax=Mucilaginibacter antarcticus TaxID=1855725 RepID=A0ABW5XRX7_9SPHI
MNHLFKNCLSLLILCLCISSAKAQVGINYKQYEFGIGLDFNTPYTDAQTSKSSRSARLNFTYNATPFVNYVVEMQTGNLQGGDALNTTTGRQFTNAYNAVMLRGQLQGGEILDYSDGGVKNALKNLYVSSGLGVILNDLKEINRYSIKVPGFYTPGSDKSKQLVVPLRLGYEFKIYNSYSEPHIKIDLGYQYNFILGDGLDGFEAGTQKDSYAQFGIGIKYAFGQIATYRKPISN